MNRIISQIVSISLWENDGSYYPLYHTSRPYHALIYMLEGEGEHQLDGKRYSYAAGTVIYLREGQEYRVLLEKAPMRCYVINFHLSDDSFFAESFFLNAMSSYQQRFQELYAHWNKKEAFFDLVCFAGVYQLMADLLKWQRQTIVPAQKQALLQQSAAYLREHSGEPDLRVEQLAPMVGVSTRRYATIFQQLYGHPPKHYLLLYRIDRAKELLVSTSRSVESIAEFCGFSDPFYFSRAFKQITGIPPLEYRKRFTGV